MFVRTPTSLMTLFALFFLGSSIAMGAQDNNCTAAFQRHCENLERLFGIKVDRAVPKAQDLKLFEEVFPKCFQSAKGKRLHQVLKNWQKAKTTQDKALQSKKLQQQGYCGSQEVLSVQKTAPQVKKLSPKRTGMPLMSHSKQKQPSPKEPMQGPKEQPKEKNLELPTKEKTDEDDNKSSERFGSVSPKREPLYYPKAGLLKGSHVGYGLLGGLLGAAAGSFLIGALVRDYRGASVGTGLGAVLGSSIGVAYAGNKYYQGSFSMALGGAVLFGAAGYGLAFLSHYAFCSSLPILPFLLMSTLPVAGALYFHHRSKRLRPKYQKGTALSQVMVYPTVSESGAGVGISGQF